MLAVNHPLIKEMLLSRALSVQYGKMYLLIFISCTSVFVDCMQYATYKNVSINIEEALGLYIMQSYSTNGHSKII